MTRWLQSYGRGRPLYQLALLLLMVLVSQGATAAPKLVLAFGDSLTAGYQLKPAESFPAQLQRQAWLRLRE